MQQHVDCQLPFLPWHTTKPALRSQARIHVEAAFRRTSKSKPTYRLVTAPDCKVMRLFQFYGKGSDGVVPVRPRSGPRLQFFTCIL